MSDKLKLDKAVQDLTESLVRATRKHGENPEKVESYIRDKVKLIYETGQHVGSTCLLDELFD